MNKVIIDSNVWIRYARIKNIDPLIDRFILYNFLPIVNNYLLAEIYDVLIENKWMDIHSAKRLIAFIRKISFVTTERAVFALSPDPKDNYLFDLAVQNNCYCIITDDKALLHAVVKPVPVHSCKWFLNSFPV